MKNNILAMLLISMISMISLTVLVSCSEEPVSDTVETTVPGAEETGADTDAEPELPDSDFLGESFMFLLRLSNHAYDEIYVYTEEYDGEVVNDAIYDRNRAVEEKYNIDIEATFIDQVSQNAQKTIMANDDSFEVMWDCKNAMPSLITNGYLVDFNTVPYLNLDAAYWDKNASEQLSVLNKLYFMP
ncbi:MAG: hypothetical protein PHZ09_14550, partial [Eubacteriales bacterium]|nr:hypothetical protein [Eubacteriales bacterium]